MNGPTLVIIVGILYIIVLYLIVKNDLTAHTKEYEGLYIFLAMLGFFLLIMVFVWAKRKDLFYGSNSGSGTPTWWGFVLKCLGVIAFFGVSIGLIFGILYAAGHIPDIVSGILVVVNLIIVAGIIAAIVLFTKQNNILFTNDKTWKGLITNIIFYLPCIWIDIVEYFKKQWKITTPTAWWILGIDIIFIVLYIYKDKIYNFFFKPKGTLLLNEPEYLNKLINLGSFENLNQDIDTENENFNYNYAISCWIYINYQGPNTNPSYTKYTNLLSYGNKPNIEYNGLKNTIRITMPQGLDGVKVIYKDETIKMNKWNHFLINYVGGTLDVFLNGELVVSQPEEIPYMTFDTVKAGDDPGIHGGICNIEYFNKSLSKSTIQSLYLSKKDKTPPVI
tara:strand:- start:926 stop:2095 length:1170 start_codon:yes stop_codon:yes gene_type:complete